MFLLRILFAAIVNMVLLTGSHIMTTIDCYISLILRFLSHHNVHSSANHLEWMHIYLESLILVISELFGTYLLVKQTDGLRLKASLSYVGIPLIIRQQKRRLKMTNVTYRLPSVFSAIFIPFERSAL